MIQQERLNIEPCNIREYSVYSDPSSNTKARGSDHLMLGKNVLQKLCMEKKWGYVNIDARTTPTPHQHYHDHLKYVHFLT